MGVNWTLRTVTGAQCESLLEDPSFIYSLPYEEQEVEAFHLGKMFWVLHFGLTGHTDWEPAGVLGNAVLALEGTVLGNTDDWDDACPRLLNSTQVALTSEALEQVHLEEFRARLLGPTESLAGVYGWEGASLERRAESLASVVLKLDMLRAFYQRATIAGLGVVTVME